MDFSLWYQARHKGHTPFPWQAALAQRVADGDWPAALTAPTGAGKTGVVAVWLWALDQGLGVPRRLVYVVDRRLIVDSTAIYARDLARASSRFARRGHPARRYYHR
jgi:CRISPR-associated endonuclease/helicase Cas3